MVNVLLTELLLPLTTKVLLVLVALLLRIAMVDSIDLHLVVFFILFSLDFDLLLNQALVFLSCLLLGLNHSILLQSVFLLDSDASVLIEQVDVFVVEFDLLLLARTALVLLVLFLRLSLVVELLFDFIIFNNEFFELYPLSICQYVI